MKVIKELELSELSLVDKPANPLALAPIFKRDTSGEEMAKEDNKDLEKALGEIETLKEENEKLRKGLIDNGFVIKADTIEKKAPVEYIEIEGEQVEKSALPDVVIKRLEAAELEKADTELAKRAEEILPNFDVEVAKSLLKFDLDDKILEALAAADAAFEAVMSEKGETASDVDMSDPSEKLKELAKAHQLANKTTYEKAYAEVVKTAEGNQLIKEIMKGNK